MRRLGIDHGDKRVGLALSDEDGVFAQPFDTLDRKGLDALVLRIAEIVEERRVAPAASRSGWRSARASRSCSGTSA